MSSSMLAMAFEQPVLALDKDKEAPDLAKAMSKVMAHYGDIPGLSEKTLDWLGLFYTVAIIIVPRASAIKMESAAKNAKAVNPVQSRSPEPTSATPMPPAPDFVEKEIPGVGSVVVPMSRG